MSKNVYLWSNAHTHTVCSASSKAEMKLIFRPIPLYGSFSLDNQDLRLHRRCLDTAMTSQNLD